MSGAEITPLRSPSSEDTEDSGYAHFHSPGEAAKPPGCVEELKQNSRSRMMLLACVGIVAFVALIVVWSLVGSPNSSEPAPGPQLCPIFCGGEILNVMQESGIFPGSKVFVDMPLRYDPELVEEHFSALPDHEEGTLRRFLAENFLPNGSDVLHHTPTDWQPSPPFLDGVADPAYRSFASAVNDVWKMLGRTMAPSVAENPTRHSLIPLPQPLIVPGGRFIEMYYWDTFWIVKGLLVCNMWTSATGLVENLLEMVAMFGFVPNGNRRYYLDRSQPPFLTEMVAEVYNVTRNDSLVVNALPLLDKESDYWNAEGSLRRVNVDGHLLNRYAVDATTPRPESYVEDIDTAERAHATTTAQKQRIWSELAGGAETGWDYSSRWFADRSLIDTITTSTIIPADLNALLCKVELTLARLHASHGSASKAAAYGDAAQQRAEAIQAVLWDPTTYQWKDYSTALQQQGPTGVLSNFLPLWSGCFPGAPDFPVASFKFPPGQSRAALNVSRLIDSLQESGLVHAGGLSTTNSSYSTHQQWDFPNAWAPLQHMLIQGLRAQTHESRATDLALSLAQRWVASNFIAWNYTGYLQEKYNALEPGVPGGGGEYTVVIGFGWTNGVVLDLLHQYGAVLAPS